MSSERISDQNAENKIKKLLGDGYIAPQIRQIMNRDHRLSFSETDHILDKLGVNPNSVPDSAHRASREQLHKERFYGNGGGISSRAIVGLVVMIIGCAVTFFSYQSAASSPTGGSYVIAYGAIIFGGIQFVRGLMGD